MKKLSLVFVLALAIASAARADDGGAWLNVQANWGSQKAYAFARGEYRSYNNFSDTEAVFGAFGVGYKFSSWFKSDLSYEIWGVNDMTIHKAVLTCNASMTREALTVSLREKFEYAVNPTVSSKNLTVRTRLRAQYAFQNSPFRPYMMAECFNSSSWVRSLYYIGTEIPVGKHNLFDIFYLYHVPAGADQEHVIGVGYYFNF